MVKTSIGVRLTVMKVPETCKKREIGWQASPHQKALITAVSGQALMLCHKLIITETTSSMMKDPYGI
jgi:hypothetical protein